jgi:purine-binding chemotaxis protein CheW
MTDQHAARADQPAPAEPSPRRSFLTFRVARRRYALPAEAVSEVIPVPPVARLPLSPKCLMGLANLRGTVIPVIDAQILLRRDTTARDHTARAIVLAGAAPFALTVDAADTLVSVDADRVETRQVEPAAERGELLLGAFQTKRAAGIQLGVEQDVTRILDLPALIRVAFGDRPVPRPGARAATAPAQQATATVAPVERGLLVSFDVGGQDYGLPLDAVREIIPLPQSIAIVPHAEAVLLGVTAWRETLLPLLSLRGLLGFPPATAWTGREKVFVTAVNGASVGLVADRARALVRAEATAIDPAPSMLAARSGGESKIVAIFRGQGGGNSGQSLISLLAPEQLFREDVMRRIADPSLHSVSQAAATALGDLVHFVVFRLGAEEFGLPIGAVDEVARVPKQITRVPKMPDFLEGVINLRGEVLPVVDQRRRFDMPKFASGGGQRLIVVRAARHRAGLIVDHVSEVFRTGAGAIEPPPDLTGEATRLVNGVINDRLANRMILLLDPSELLTPVEHSALDQLEPGSGAENDGGSNVVGSL